MDKISPLRAGFDAISKFRTNKAAKNEQNSVSTNPFGVSFASSRILQRDVFDSSKQNNATNPIKDNFKNFAAKAKEWGANVKKNAVAFGGNVKSGLVAFGGKVKNSYNKLASKEVSLNLFGNPVSKLQKKPVAELEGMFKKELAEV